MISDQLSVISYQFTEKTPYTLHPTPHTPHPTPYTPHPTPYTLHPTPHTLHPTPRTPHPTPLRIRHRSIGLCNCQYRFTNFFVETGS
ncbi:hypothetical protein O53_3610 [Microcystis aeruginosa TAIHU98]|uniref:Uncharacterized protein n=1 Tax=Microcystis aeruginosa TAIHU98 TaxID=1134457 RepID=L7E5P3_MICAE|nr:hypothetical protein O53_3610 [Microcystis aeruginosa TAIHU98]